MKKYPSSDTVYYYYKVYDDDIGDFVYRDIDSEAVLYNDTGLSSVEDK